MTSSNFAFLITLFFLSDFFQIKGNSINAGTLLNKNDAEISKVNQTWSNTHLQVKNADPSRAPKNLRVVFVTNTSLTLLWEEPEPKPESWQIYEVSWKTEDGNETVRTTDKLYYVIRHLMPYTVYTVKVGINTLSGNKEWTEEIPVRTGAGIPSTPTGVTVTKSTSTSISIVWDVPAGPVDYYNVRFTGGIGFGSVTGVASRESYTMSNLTPNRTYIITVWAYTSAGSSPESEPITATTGIRVVIKNLNVTYTNTSLTLLWEEPELKYEFWQGYEVSWQSSYSNETVNTTDKPYFNLTHLLPYTYYIVKVRIKTPDENQPWLKEHVRTGVGVPFPPVDATITYSNYTSISLKWNQPIPNVGPVKFYDVQWANQSGAEMASGISGESYTISDLTPCTNYTITVRAHTDAGTGDWSEEVIGTTMLKECGRKDRTLRSAPVQQSRGQNTVIGIDVPRNLNVTYVTNTSLTLEWEEPEPKPELGQIYEVFWKSEDGYETVKTTDKLNFVITDLMPYTVYSVKVRLSTTSENKQWSEEIHVRTDVGVPFPPTGVTVTDTTNTSIYVAWDSPVPYVGEIEFYDVKWISPVGEGMRSNLSRKSHIIFQLTFNTTYRITVRAHTSAGAGQWSEEVTGRTILGDVQHIPRNLSAVYVTNTSMLLVWEEPEIKTHLWHTYSVSWKNKYGFESVATYPELKLTLKDLVPYTVYTIKVRLVMHNYYEPWSEEIRVRTGIGIPSAPTRLNISHFNSTSITVVWNAPVPEAGPVIYYTLQSSSEESFRSSSGFKGESYTLSELTPYMKYKIKVQASTSAGNGPWSEVVIGTTGTRDSGSANASWIWIVAVAVIVLVTIAAAVGFYFYRSRKVVNQQQTTVIKQMQPTINS